MKKRFLALSLALAMCLAMLTGCGGGNDAATDDGGSTDDAAPGTPEVTWVASCANADDHPAVQGVHKFAELVEEKSGGRMHIDVFANAQLASDRDCIEGMQMNTIQSGIMVSSALAGFTDELLVFDLPFLFENSAQGQAVCDSDVGQQILGTLEDIGIKGLGWMEYGMRNITNSVRPIEKPEDLQGIKIRTMENPIHMAAFQVMGADPTPMAFGELFTALQQGTIDAQENPFEVIYANRLYEQQDYVILTNHLPASHNLLISQVVYNGLSDTDKELIMAVGKAAIQYSREQCDARLSERMDLVAQTGTEIVELPADVLGQLQDKCSGVYDEVRATYGDELVDMQISTAEKYA